MKNTRRIKENREFRRLYARGKNHVGAYLAIYAKRNKLGINRVGFTCGKSVGNAVTRNRVKRLMRESYFRRESRIHGCDMIIVARARAAKKSFAQIYHDMGYVMYCMHILENDKSEAKRGKNEESTDFFN